MFIAFEASQSSEEGLQSPRHRRGERIGRRGSMVRACNFCRRRKIKCNGEKPCEACQWYKKSELCSYSERRQSPSQQKSAYYRAALERLFPGTAPDSIAHLPREKLLELVTAGSHEQAQQDSPSLALSIETQPLSIGPPGLESLHSMPEEPLDPDQGTSASGSFENISDDVNGLSLNARQPASYLGISSTQAAMKVIAWLHPQLQSYLPQSSRTAQSMPSLLIEPGSSLTEVEMIDAYFVNFHPLAPLVDEKSFRATHLVGNQKDNRWLALFNIVLALGSIAASGAENHDHRTYYSRAMSLLDLATLGSPSLEAVQALGLIGGWYCHYISQPNLGYSLMGASLRMAVTLGLQREPYDGRLIPDPARAAHQEFRRRVWWALCCLETWGHETLGRPCMDFFAPSITVSQPRLLDQEHYLVVLPLIENVEFIKIASKVQESLAALPMLTHKEIFDMDSQLHQWWSNLPPVLKDHEPCPESLYTARTVMRWRYYNQRMLLYRPKLLNFAMRRVPLMAIREEERNAISKCREIAELSIQDISMTSKLNQMIGWNGVWLLFQATMVPLIYLSTRSTNDDSAAAFDACKTQVETALLTLGRMKPYGHTAERSLEVASGILKVSLQSPGTTKNPGSSNIPFLSELDCYPPATPDWTVPSFDNLPLDSMWEYLSWDGHDIWPDVFGSFDDQPLSIFPSTADT